MLVGEDSPPLQVLLPASGRPLRRWLRCTDPLLHRRPDFYWQPQPAAALLCDNIALYSPLYILFCTSMLLPFKLPICGLCCNVTGTLDDIKVHAVNSLKLCKSGVIENQTAVEDEAC